MITGGDMKSSGIADQATSKEGTDAIVDEMPGAGAGKSAGLMRNIGQPANALNRAIGIKEKVNKIIDKGSPSTTSSDIDIILYIDHGSWQQTVTRPRNEIKKMRNNVCIYITKLILLFLIIVFYSMSCRSHDCYTHEFYENGKVKLKVCIIDEKNDFFRFTEYYENGVVKSTYDTKRGKLNGLRFVYFPTGEKQTKCNLKDDLRNGYCYEYLKNGKISSMNYCFEDKTIYGRYYRYDSIGVSVSENFDPIVDVVVKKDKKTILFTINLPIPDSLTRKSSSILKYDLKPKSLRDSFVLKTKYSVEISHNKPFHGELEIEEGKEQIFYGYIADNEKQIAFNPFEILINLARSPAAEE
jgi:hypothetical protein